MLDLGREVARHLFEAELDYLVRHEWARTAEDVLWRRSRLGLHVGADTAARLEQFLDADTTPARREAVGQ